MDALVYINGAIYRPPSRLMLRSCSEPANADLATKQINNANTDPVGAPIRTSGGAGDSGVSGAPDLVSENGQQSLEAGRACAYEAVEDLLGGYY